MVTKGSANDCDVLIRINEIESDGGAPADWIELYNPSAQPVSLAGYVLSDNVDASRTTLPAGTTIPANGYLVLEQEQLGFALDAADAVRLYRPNGTALVDSFSWTSHAATTFGRCPDGVGALIVTSAATKGAANSCVVATTTVKINEVESNGGTPGDWVELINIGATAVDLSGYVFRDNDDSRVPYTLPAGTIIAAGGYLVLDEAQFGFGLGAGDAARLFAPGGGTLVDSYTWTAHAATTYGRCPNGTGAFVTSPASTKGTPNNCGILAVAVKINEIESDGGTPGDWVELFNTGATTADISGYIFRDNVVTGGYVIPAGTTIAPGAYLVLEQAQFSFGLGGGDQAQFIAPDGTTVLDSYTWTAHATTTYGRCPNGTGSFATTLESTKGAANNCPAPPTFFAWPGDATVVSETFGNTTFGGNMSGLAYQASGTSAPGVMWAVRNGPGALFRLVWTGSAWARDAANDWSAGKLLRYPNGLGDVDAEGVALVGSAIYVASERNNASNSVSRNSILRYDPSVSGTTLTAAMEWDITADLPANGANLGLEGITFVPDAYLVARGFRVQGTNALYNPANYPDHGDGLFFVGVEATGAIHAYALNQVTGSFTRLATFTSGFPVVMELSFDRELNQLWAICDNGCNGRSTILSIDTQSGSSSLGSFVVTQRFERPSGLPDVNNEGFTLAPQAECVSGRKPVFWVDDNETGGISLRRGLVTCSAF
ncbi:hypothetical protein GEMMAAP_00560 [Gemmatimonas phototrophica]|uniref:LTD domain-containing protein n=1 Tax=Gemmatimonas phototrophica TaxID=1379270 RepID=A0A143BN39_9BACT|nr:hypothetical protein GEMMAAP_00560 [Gemmatimonas phototrophica]